MVCLVTGSSSWHGRAAYVLWDCHASMSGRCLGRVAIGVHGVSGLAVVWSGRGMGQLAGLAMYGL